MRRRDWLFSSAATAAGMALPPVLRAQERLQFQTWETQIQKLLPETKVPGVSVTVIVNGSIRWSKGFGVKLAGSSDRVDPQTIFQAASMSKPVFAYAVMKLVEKGILQLDTPLTRYTPQRILADDPRLDLITARHVLSHSTGFPNWRSSSNPLRIQFTPGEKYGYSGEGYNYLQSVVTHLTGHEDRTVCLGGYEGDLEVCATDIAGYLEGTLLRPLGMSSSSYLPKPAFRKRMARGHDQKGAPMKPAERKATDPARYAAAGGLLTTTVDYARFLLEVVNAGAGDAHRLGRASVQEMLRPQTLVNENPEYTISWALGWRVARTKAGEWISHAGDNPGFHSLAEISPARKTGFVIMTNGDGGGEFLSKFAPGMSRDLSSF